MQHDLLSFIKKVRELGYKIKLDTNGYLPQKLLELLEENLLDYIAMDIKAGTGNYSKVSGIPDFDLNSIIQSISIIENSGVDYEFRTTVVKELHSKQDFYEIKDMVSPHSSYYLQSFHDSGNILSHGLSCCDKPTLIEYLTILQSRLPKAKLRGID